MGEATLMYETLRQHPRFEARIECSGETHRLRWLAGEIEALDHDDIEGERALVGLGGEPCTCIDVLDGWARHQDDLRVLILTTRGTTDEIDWSSVRNPPGGPSAGITLAASPMTYPRAGLARGTPRRGTRAPGAPPPLNEDDLLPLLAVDGGLARRLAVTVAACCAERLVAGDRRVGTARAALTAALHGRVVCAVREWLGQPNADVEVEMLAPGHTPDVVALTDGLRVSLPFDWVVDVWGRGVPVVMDRFVLAVHSSTLDRLTLLTADTTLVRGTLAIELG